VKKSHLTLLIIALLIASIGILSIYSSTYRKEGSAWKAAFKRQIIWIILGVCIFLIISNVNYRRVLDATNFLYGLTVFLLFLVFIIGVVRLGAQRWLKFFWINFQPSELAKLTLLVFLAKYFSFKSIDDISLKVKKFGVVRSLLIPLFFVSIPAGLIVEQPDLGSAVMVFSVFIIMLFVSGVRIKYIFSFLSLILLSLPFLWHFLRDYQKERLLVFLNPNIDPLGAGYTVIQSKIAIGSGGMFGKGWLSGTQSQLHFLPEAHTDFIFATFAEEWGAFGAVILLLLYYLLIRQGIAIGMRTNDYFGRLLAVGISSLLCLQVFTNIAMNLGLAPVVGLPLPLMSYGGSSIFVTFTALGILANIDRTRAVF
jgi:rod shape determining protein RodA